MTVEFDCEGCGDHVHAFAMDKPPHSGLCFMCEYFCEHFDPVEMMAMRHHLGLFNPQRPSRETRRT